jgi:hypothetical protein
VPSATFQLVEPTNEIKVRYQRTRVFGYSAESIGQILDKAARAGTAFLRVQV